MRPQLMSTAEPAASGWAGWTAWQRHTKKCTPAKSVWLIVEARLALARASHVCEVMNTKGGRVSGEQDGGGCCWYQPPVNKHPQQCSQRPVARSVVNKEKS